MNNVLLLYGGHVARVWLCAQAAQMQPSFVQLVLCF